MIGYAKGGFACIMLAGAYLVIVLRLPTRSTNIDSGTRGNMAPFGYARCGLTKQTRFGRIKSTVRAS